ncbi:MAG: NAD-dependent epimerase/dehydratase family protein [Aliarcobacter sp.]
MLKHHFGKPLPTGRALILGAGFVGGEVARRLAFKGWKVSALRSADLDLTTENAGEKLSAHFEAGDTLVFVSAKAPVKNPDMLVANLRMAQAVLKACAKTVPAHLVYVSSDAVYADEPRPLSEATPTAPSSLHGVMHLARELMLQTLGDIPLAVVRPTLVYGEGDPHNGYGPNQFLRLAREKKPIVLFGEGEERRDHVHVGDVGEIIARLVVHGSTGVINAVSGQAVSFREIADMIATKYEISVQTRPRTGLMPHGGLRPFDPKNLFAAFPDFKCTSLVEGSPALID